MRLVAFGFLAATLFGAGCALQPGDPGEPAVTTSSQLSSNTAPKIRTATAAQPAGSSTPPVLNPEPQPWLPPDPTNPDTSGQNPEPDPWNVGIPLQGPASGSSGGNPGNNPGGSSQGGTTAGTTYTGTVHQVGHWDARSSDVF